MVATGEGGRVERIEIKPAQTELRYSWMIAVWGPRFTEHLHGHLAEVERLRADPNPGRRPQREVFVGDVIRSAIGAGLQVSSVSFPQGEALDVGTPESMVRAVRRYAGTVDPTTNDA
jgi:glucose-1-phosphate thymidylyltransferase